MLGEFVDTNGEMLGVPGEVTVDCENGKIETSGDCANQKVSVRALNSRALTDVEVPGGRLEVRAYHPHQAERGEDASRELKLRLAADAGEDFLRHGPKKQSLPGADRFAELFPQGQFDGVEACLVPAQEK